MNNYDNIDENELASLICSGDENIKDIVFSKYNYIVDIMLRKYHNIIKKLQLDEEEIRCEALYGFSDGINSYSENRNASLKTFLSLCIERRIIKFFKKNSTEKSKINNNQLSLNYVIPESGQEIIDLIKDYKFDPLNNITTNENKNEIIKCAELILSNFEFEVFNYMINGLDYIEIAKILNKNPKQIDNCIQRIKNKMRKILAE